jgi:chromosomal replication initiation ATPase DnaA
MDKRKYNVGAIYTYLAPESKIFINKVLKEFDLTKEEIVSTRLRPVVQIKQIIYWFLVNKFKENYSAIGRYFGNNHATIIHSCKQAELIKELKK